VFQHRLPAPAPAGHPPAEEGNAYQYRMNERTCPQQDMFLISPGTNFYRNRPISFLDLPIGQINISLTIQTHSGNNIVR